MTTTTDAAIRCEDLSRTYGDVKALDALNLSVPQGAIFGFLGRNGAGKTTTMRLLTGLAHPTRGSAWIAGVETTNGSQEAAYEFGYLPQHPVFYGWMRAWEYLDYIGRLYKLPAKLRKTRIDEVLEKVGLQDAKKRRIAGFSGGMKQRLGIAQAIIHQPKVLLLDEPTSALDPAGRYEVLDWIKNLNGDTTVFLSSHILDDVERICDQIAILHKGKLVRSGASETILNEYAVNAVDIVVDAASETQLHGFAEQLKNQPWVEETHNNPRSLRVMISDIQAGKESLMQVIQQAGLSIAKVEWVRPTLEQVFLELSE